MCRPKCTGQAQRTWKRVHSDWEYGARWPADGQPPASSCAPAAKHLGLERCSSTQLAKIATELRPYWLAKPERPRVVRALTHKLAGLQMWGKHLAWTKHGNGKATSLMSSSSLRSASWRGTPYVWVAGLAYVSFAPALPGCSYATRATDGKYIV